jgi:hypothetical protein
MLEDVPKEGEGLKICGSAMMAHASSKEEVLEMIKKDIYVKHNIWNMDKVRFPSIFFHRDFADVCDVDPNLSRKKKTVSDQDIS